MRPYVADSIVTFEIERAKIVNPAVTYYGTAGTDGKTGYIEILQRSGYNLRTRRRSTVDQHCQRHIRRHRLADNDFATMYAASHDSIPAATEFVVTDSIFAEFKRFIDPDKLSLP